MDSALQALLSKINQWLLLCFFLHLCRMQSKLKFHYFEKENNLSVELFNCM